MAVNKVEINGATVLDLTSDTVTEYNLLKGVTAHNHSGEKIEGTMESSGLSLPTFRVNNFTMSDGLATFTILSSATDSVNLNLNAFALSLGTVTKTYVFPAIMLSANGTQKTYQAASIGSSGYTIDGLSLVQNLTTNVYTWNLVSTSSFEDQDLYNGNVNPLVYSLENS